MLVGDNIYVIPLIFCVRLNPLCNEYCPREYNLAAFDLAFLAVEYKAIITGNSQLI